MKPYGDIRHVSSNRAKVVCMCLVSVMVAVLVVSGARASWMPADVDGDFTVNAVDVQLVINAALGVAIPPGASAANLDAAGPVDAVDVQLAVNSALGIGTGGKIVCRSAKTVLAGYYETYSHEVAASHTGPSLPLELEEISNYAWMSQIFSLDERPVFLSVNGFVVVPFPGAEKKEDVVDAYDRLETIGVPIFVTSDSLLHLYHIQFDEALKDIEEREFIGTLAAMTRALLARATVEYHALDGELKEAALRNVAYFSVPLKLLDPAATVPESVEGVVTDEIALIEGHEGFSSSPLFTYREDYSQYVPRGHYTRSDELKKYFKAMMWYGRMACLLKGAENWGPAGEALVSVEEARIQTTQAVLLAKWLTEVQVDGHRAAALWDRLYGVTAFFVGLADDLTPFEYHRAACDVLGVGFASSALTDAQRFLEVKVELATMRSPLIFGGTGEVVITPPVTEESLDEVLDKTKGMRFMGQRFIPDSYMFQHMVFPEVLDYLGDGTPFTLGRTGGGWARCYPMGLDVMRILGSDRAAEILEESGDTDYVDYERRAAELTDEFAAFTEEDWNRNLYWGWLYALKALIAPPPAGYPPFMTTRDWADKQLNAALASWTQLRHDTILYAKQSSTPGYTSIPPQPIGYVEPVPEFYGRLLALTRMTRDGLTDMNVLDETARARLESLEAILERLIDISIKELEGTPLTEDDAQFIRTIGSSLESVVLDVDNTGVKTTLVADVHTHSIEETVVEEAVGYLDAIVVAQELPDGTLELAAGPVFSYYEFKHPMSDRLTDEAWRDMLESGTVPARPWWIESLDTQ